MVALAAFVAWYFARRSQWERQAQEAVRAADDPRPVVPREPVGPVLRVEVLPREGGDPALTRWWVRLGDTAWDLVVPTSDAPETTRRAAVETLERTLADIVDTIARLRAQAGERATGVIRHPHPSAGPGATEVVVRLADAFLQAGVTDVTMDGSLPADAQPPGGR
jgi:hypothetical protein